MRFFYLLRIYSLGFFLLSLPNVAQASWFFGNSDKGAWLTAADRGDLPAMRRLVGRVDINAGGFRGRTALMRAASRGDTRMMRFLINSGANINASCWWNGKTALMCAAGGGSLKSVELLINSGANSAGCSYFCDTASDYAKEKGYRSIFNLLEEGRPQFLNPLVNDVIRSFSRGVAYATLLMLGSVVYDVFKLLFL